MRNNSIALLILAVFVTAGCNDSSSNEPFIDNKLNKAWLNKIINKSDSSYTKPYYRSDFVTATYHINKKDSLLTQVMKDSAGNVKQVMIEKNKVRSFFAQYYINGQVMAILPVGKNGRFEGDAVFYCPAGKIKSKGKYVDGFYSGVWELYDEAGKLTVKETYDNNGQLINTTEY